MALASHSPLSSRERVRLALAHQETDRVPLAMVCAGINEPARRAFDDLLHRERHTDVDSFLDAVLDVQSVGPAWVGPTLAPGTDPWGVGRRPVSYGPATYDEIVHHPLATAPGPAALRDYPWPTPACFDYAALAAQVQASQRQRERCLMIANANPFETAWALRGFEQLLLDFAVAPEFAHGLMDRVTAFYLDHFARMLAAAPGQIDLAFTADDVAGQQGLLLSPRMWAEFIKPYHVRLNRRIHEFGVKVIYHSDGAIMAAVPGFIAMGIDVLQALQFDAHGMDPARLKREYGDRLCFEGGVSVQKTLPFGTPDDVRAETQRLIATLGHGGGYILGPAHAIQAGTPPANIMAMFDTALEYRPGR